MKRILFDTKSHDALMGAISFESVIAGYSDLFQEYNTDS